MSERDYDEQDESEQFGDRRRRQPANAPSVIFRTEPDFLLRTLVGAVVALLTFMCYAVYTGNREQGEMRGEFRVYTEATDRRITVLENAVQRMLENR